MAKQPNRRGVAAWQRRSSRPDKTSSDDQLASAVRESAEQIWLAGLGAFAKAQQEGTKVFEALVREGDVLQQRTRAVTEQRLEEVADRFTEAATQLSRQATQSWDRLEQVFEDRVARALSHLGVPERPRRPGTDRDAAGAQPAHLRSRRGPGRTCRAHRPAKAAQADAQPRLRASGDAAAATGAIARGCPQPPRRPAQPRQGLSPLPGLLAWSRPDRPQAAPPARRAAQAPVTPDAPPRQRSAGAIL